MAALARLSAVLIDCPSCNPTVKHLGVFRHRSSFSVTAVDSLRRLKNLESSDVIICSASNGPSSSEISSTAKIRSEVLSPFRSVRMFFYIAFIASGSLGGLIAISQLIGALANPSRAAEVPEILKGLGIDFGAVFIFAFLYYRDNNAKNAQVARLSREEFLSNLKLRVDEKRIVALSAFRGIARLVILAGPASYIEESFKRSEPFSGELVERGVLVVPFATDGNSFKLEFEETEETKEMNMKRKRLWQLTPVYAAEWNKWLDEQKKLANVSPESPVDIFVKKSYTSSLFDNLLSTWDYQFYQESGGRFCYLSLRLDGRVRGSGVGYPPWNAFVVQLPPVKGMWSGLLDGMDGRVL